MDELMLYKNIGPSVERQLSAENESIQITTLFEQPSSSMFGAPLFTPLAVFEGETYYVWLDSDYRPWITKVRGNGNIVTQPLDPNPEYTATRDGHNNFSLAVDKNGYIHVMGDMHSYNPTRPGYLPKYQGAYVMYWVSKNPKNIWEFEFVGHNLSRVPDATDYSYMNFHVDNNGELYLVARVGTGSQHQYAVGLYKYNTTTKSWETRGDLPDYPGIPPTKKVLFYEYNSAGWYQGYQTGIFFDRNNRMHFAVAVNAIPGSERPTHIAYAYSDDGGLTFYKADGTPIEELPLGVSSGPNQADIVCEPPDEYTTTCYAFADGNGNPAISYSTQINGIGQPAGYKYWNPETKSWSDFVPLSAGGAGIARHYVDNRGIITYFNTMVTRSSAFNSEQYRIGLKLSAIDEASFRKTGVITGLQVIDGQAKIIRAVITPTSWSHNGYTSFNGTSTYVEGDKALDWSGQNLTVVFRMTAAKQAQMIPIDKFPATGSKGWRIMLTGNGRLIFRIGSNTSYTDAVVQGAYSKDTPINVACTYSLGTAKVYINGTLMTTVTGITQTVDETKTPIRLGIPSSVDTNLKYKGTLGYVKVFDSLLTESQIQEYANGLMYMHKPVKAFDGNQTLLDIGPKIGSENELTVAFSMTVNVAANRTLFRKQPSTGNAGWAVTISPNDLDSNFRVGSAASTSYTRVINTYTVGTPVHYAATYSNGTAKVYINGNLARTTNGITQTVNDATLPLLIGTNLSTYFEGTMKNIRIFERALSDQEIAALAAE